MAGIRYLDFDLHIQRAGEDYQARVLNSPGGQATGAFHVPFSDLELENFVLRVGRARGGARRIDSPEVGAAKTFGERLFSAVFSGEVRGCLRSSLDEADRQGAGLRIRLRLTDVPELADLPWEYLYNPTLNRFLALSIETPFVRYLELAERVRPLPVRPPLRVLVMISSPNDYPRLDVEREWTKLREAVGDLEQRGLLALERMDEATLASLQRRLRRGECHIFHFIGHGGFDRQSQDGLLVMEDEHGRGRPVSGQDLGMLLHDHRAMRLAILNACEGARSSRSDPFAGTAQSLVQQGVPAVIAMQFEITDEAAISFAHEFYGAVADDYPVDAALAEARKAMFAQGHALEWGTPVLYLRCPDGRIFERQGEIVAGRRDGAATVGEKRHVEARVTQDRSLIEAPAKPSGRRWRPVGMGILAIVLVIAGMLWIMGKGPPEDVSPPSTPQPVSLALRADKSELKVKEHTRLIVQASYSDGTQKDVIEGVQWSSSDASVAAIRPDGDVVGLKEGKAQITARYATVLSPPVDLSVRAEEPGAQPPPPPVKLVSLAVHAHKRDLRVRESMRLAVKGIYSNGGEEEISTGIQWRSTDETIAAVDPRGQVVGRREGNANITAERAGVVSPPLTLFVRQAAEKSPPQVPVRDGRIKNHISVARSYREQGEYSHALSELEKARALDPANQEIQAEIEATRKACDAERRLGRAGLLC